MVTWAPVFISTRGGKGSSDVHSAGCVRCAGARGPVWEQAEELEGGSPAVANTSYSSAPEAMLPRDRAVKRSIKAG